MDESYIREFISIGTTDRSIDRYFRDLAALSVLVNNIASIKDEAARRGVCHASDESRLLLALCPSRNELDLEMKASMLVGGKGQATNRFRRKNARHVCEDDRAHVL